jgi:DNA-binding transcriptional LysR family regulator
MPAVRDLNLLNTFVRVAERRSFTKAAQDLRMTPSVVSKHISELEDMLGFSLVTRSTHGVVLTEVGESFFKSCLALLENIEDFVVTARNVETGPYGTLRIQATTGFARWSLAPLIPVFIRRYPHLRIELVTEAVMRNPVEEGCDVIVTDKKPAGPGLVGNEIGVIQHVICAAPAYFERASRPRSPQDLRRHNCLVNSPFAPKEWWFSEGEREIAVEVKGSFCSNSSAVLIEVAIEGLGIVRVPHYAARAELASGKLEQIFADNACSREHMAVYYSKSKHLPAKTTAFIAFLQAAFGADAERPKVAQGGKR